MFQLGEIVQITGNSGDCNHYAKIGTIGRISNDSGGNHNPTRWVVTFGPNTIWVDSFSGSTKEKVRESEWTQWIAETDMRPFEDNDTESEGWDE